MSANTESLEPPKEVNPSATSDPGARQLAEYSDSEDNFTDAQSAPASPIPKTRVEKVDNEPSHGEVVGTEAHAKRIEDAQPDEVAVMSNATPTAETTDPIPATVVETSAGETAPHSDEFEEKRKADAAPDAVVSSEEKAMLDSATVTSQAVEDASPTPVQAPLAMPSDGANDDDDEEDDDNDNDKASEGREQTQHENKMIEEDEEKTIEDQEDLKDQDGGVDKEAVEDQKEAQNEEEDEDEDEFGDEQDGDDFDDFEEGGEDDDFDDFEDGFQQAEPTPPPIATPQPEMDLPFPVPDFDDMSSDDIISATEPYLASLFPPEGLNFPDFPPPSKDSAIFSTPRSASLWSQLVAPPPLAPPDWIRCRTRRLFLVSLGVPVDLDEILPASKQKKLVLPSLNIPATSPRGSTETRSLSRIRQGDGNGSSTSVDTQGKSSKSKGRKGPPPEPDFDLVSAKHLCKTTGEALDGMTEDELKAHVEKLEAMQNKSKEVLEYWQKRTDEKIGDREAFEAVIENLVKHARKVRK